MAPEAGDQPASPVSYFGHGTTVATNALIQHKGVPTGLVTTDGFRDLLEIGRQKRPECKGCRYDSVCEGVWGNYLAHYGWDEFKPVPA